MSVLTPKGLSNLGNTCFMNSALQCITHSPNMAQFFLDLSKDKRALAQQDILYIVLDYFKSYSSSQRVYSPQNMFRSLRKINPILTPGRQHDSHEFILGLLDKVETGLKQRKMLNQYKDKFIGELCSEVTCQNCNYVSQTKENFTVLSLVNVSHLNFKMLTVFRKYRNRIMSCSHLVSFSKRRL